MDLPRYSWSAQLLDYHLQRRLGNLGTNYFILCRNSLAGYEASAGIKIRFCVQIFTIILISATFVFLQDRTSVIVGVKAELGASDPEAPDMGRIQFFVDWYVLSQIDKVGSRT